MDVSHSVFIKRIFFKVGRIGETLFFITYCIPNFKLHKTIRVNNLKIFIEFETT